MTTESFAVLFEQTDFDSRIRPGEIISGRIIDVGADVVTIDAGLKSEALIPIAEFRNVEGDIEATVGDDIEVALEAVENGLGETKLSRAYAIMVRTWKDLESAVETQDSVFGVIDGKVRGGFTVNVAGVRAFLPGSLVDVQPVRDYDEYEGMKCELKVLKIDRERNNIVVSRRAVVQESRQAEMAELISKLEEGAVMHGIVKNLTDYGAFVDLGGLDGLLHITDMSWKRIRKPSEVVEVGDEIDVVILSFDVERRRVSLGLKQLQEDPWVDISRTYPVGSRLFGRVSNLTDYGFFVELVEGVEGLVHMSEIDWVNRNVVPSKVAGVNDEVEVMVLDIDEKRRRISLGMKQCTTNPWEEFSALNKKGDIIKGVVKSITEFGVFLGFESGIDGLLHISDLSWTHSGDEVIKQYQKGQDVEAMVLSIDADRERIALGVKQLDKDPFSAYLADHGKGGIVTGKVIEVTDRKVTVQLSGSVTGVVRVGDLSRERVDDARNFVSEGDDIEAKIINVDRRSRVLSLSVKAKDKQEEVEALKQYGKAEIFGGTSSLGDLFKDKIKDQMGGAGDQD